MIAGEVSVSSERDALRKTLQTFRYKNPSTPPASPIQYLKQLVAEDIRRLYGKEDFETPDGLNESALWYAEKRLNKFFESMGVCPERAYKLISDALSDVINLAWPNPAPLNPPFQTSPHRRWL